VVSISAFEHLGTHEHLLTELRRVIKNGYLVVNVPNPKAKGQGESSHHVTALNKKGWIKRLQKEGFLYKAKLSNRFEGKRTLIYSNSRLHAMDKVINKHIDVYQKLLE
jgi:hypothetical protein